MPETEGHRKCINTRLMFGTWRHNVTYTPYWDNADVTACRLDLEEAVLRLCRQGSWATRVKYADKRQCDSAPPVKWWIRQDGKRNWNRYTQMCRRISSRILCCKYVSKVDVSNSRWQTVSKRGRRRWIIKQSLRSVECFTLWAVWVILCGVIS